MTRFAPEQTLAIMGVNEIEKINLPKNSISRVFFFSLGTAMFLVLGLFWIGLAFDFSALENFLVNLCYSYFVGFTIPQLLGSASVDSIVEQVFRLKIICTICVVLYGGFIFYVGTLKNKKLKLNFLYFSVIVPVTLFISYLWLKVISEDHILSRIEKVELSQFTIFSLVAVVVFVLLSLRKEKAISSKKVSSQIPTVDDLKNDLENSFLSDGAMGTNIDQEETDGTGDQEKTVKEPTEDKVTHEGVDESAGPLSPPSMEESTPADTLDDELPPPPVTELPAELADLKDDIGTGNPDPENSELGKVSKGS